MRLRCRRDDRGRAAREFAGLKPSQIMVHLTCSKSYFEKRWKSISRRSVTEEHRFVGFEAQVGVSTIVGCIV